MDAERPTLLATARSPVSGVRVLGGLSLTCGTRAVVVPAGARRLLAYLALHPGGVDRRSAAGVLWPSVGDARAAGNLRSALWRLQQVGHPLVVADQWTIALGPDVAIDLNRIEAWATRVLTAVATPADLAVDPATVADLEVLPGWYDDWV